MWLLERLQSDVKREPALRFLFHWDLDPNHASVQSEIRASSWKSNVFPQYETPQSNWALFVDFAVHKLYELIQQYSVAHNKEISIRLLNLMDCYWPMVKDIEKCPVGLITAKLDQKWWMRHHSREYTDSVPRVEDLSDGSASRLWEGRRHLIHSNQTMSAIEFENDPVCALLKAAWPKKHLIQQFVAKCSKIFALHVTVKNPRKDGPKTVHKGLQVVRRVVEWWCLFHLGGYRHSSGSVTQWSTRMKYVDMWNTARSPSVTNRWLVEQANMMLEHPILLLYTIKEFTLHAVRCTPAIHRWLCERAIWSDYDTHCVRLLDGYRAGKKTIEGDLIPYLKCMCVIGFHTKHPVCYWSHIHRTVKSARIGTSVVSTTAAAAAATAVATTTTTTTTKVKRELPTTVLIPGMEPPTPVTTLSIRQSIIPLFQNQPKLWSIEPFILEEETAIADAGIHPRFVHSFMVCRRILLYSLYYYRVTPAAIRLCIASLIAYYRRRCGKHSLGAIVTELLVDHPYAYTIWRCIIQAWSDWNYIWQIPVSHEMMSYQLGAIERRTDGVPPNPKLDWVLFCQNCWDIKSLYVPHTFHNFRPEKWDPRSIAGFKKLLVDIHTDKWTCVKKTGQKTAVCENTPVVYLHAVGRIIIIGRRSITICPQCGNMMEMDPEHDRYNTFGVMCLRCRTTTHFSAGRMLAAWAKGKHDNPVLNNRMHGAMAWFVDFELLRMEKMGPKRTKTTRVSKQEEEDDDDADEKDGWIKDHPEQSKHSQMEKLLWREQKLLKNPTQKAAPNKRKREKDIDR